MLAEEDLYGFKPCYCCESADRTDRPTKSLQIDESELDVLSVIFKKPAYQPRCYPKELFYRTFSPELTPMVQANVLEGDALPD